MMIRTLAQRVVVLALGVVLAAAPPGAARAAGSISNSTVTIAGTVTLTVTVTLQSNFTPTTGTCAVTLTSSDPHGAAATFSATATIASGKVTCAPATSYSFLVNDKTGTVTVGYNITLYDVSGQFKNASGASYLLPASAANPSPNLTLALTM